MNLLTRMFLGRPVDVQPIEPLVQSHTAMGTALAATLRANLERHGRVHVHVLGEGMTAHKVWPPQNLGKAYGRASTTIHHLRGECALLREGIAARDEANDAVTAERDQLAATLARQQYRKLREEGGPSTERVIRAVLWNHYPQVNEDGTTGSACACTAPLPSGWVTHTAHELVAAGLLAPETSPGGGASAEAPHAPTHLGPPPPGDPADTATVGYCLPAGWDDAQGSNDDDLCGQENTSGFLVCTRRRGHHGQHVGGAGLHVMGVWPAEHVISLCPRCMHLVGPQLPARTICGACETEVGTRDADLAAQVDAHLDHLARVLAERDLDMLGATWATTREPMREMYRTRAADVINAGWAPPGYQPTAVDRTVQVPVVAGLLFDHRPQPGDIRRCACGWDGPSHFEHVAGQLVGTGAIAR